MESDDLDVKFEAWFKEQQTKGNLPWTMTYNTTVQVKKVARMAFIWAWHHGYEEGATDTINNMKTHS